MSEPTAAAATPETPAAAPATGTALSAGKTAAPAAAAAAIQVTVGDESWKDKLPEDLRNDPSIKITKSLDDLAKGYVHSQKMIGADKIVIPSKHATPEEIRAVKVKLGLPETLDKFTLEAPEGVAKDAPFLKKFSEAAHKIGIFPSDAQQLLAWYHQESVATQKAGADAAKAKGAEELAGLKKEFGQAYDAKIKAAVTAIENVMGKEAATKLIDDPTIGGHPDFIRFVAKIADMMSEDTEVGADGKPAGIFTPAEAQKRINAMMGDSKHPYNLADHPSHKEAVKEMQQFFDMLHPESA